jgi:hypothetical protein
MLRQRMESSSARSSHQCGAAPSPPNVATTEAPVTEPKKASDRTLTGECLCGAVHYAVTDEFVYAANCHCSNCRRATGSAFKPFAGIERHKLHVTKGEDNLMIFGDENGNDARCKVCGSFLYRSSATVPSSTSLWEPSSTIRPSARPSTSSLAPRRRGSQSATTSPNTKNM